MPEPLYSDSAGDKQAQRDGTEEVHDNREDAGPQNHHESTRQPLQHAAANDHASEEAGGQTPNAAAGFFHADECVGQLDDVAVLHGRATEGDEGFDGSGGDQLLQEQADSGEGAARQGRHQPPQNGGAQAGAIETHPARGRPCEGQNPRQDERTGGDADEKGGLGVERTLDQRGQHSDACNGNAAGKHATLKHQPGLAPGKPEGDGALAARLPEQGEGTDRGEIAMRQLGRFPPERQQIPGSRGDGGQHRNKNQSLQPGGLGPELAQRDACSWCVAY